MNALTFSSLAKPPILTTNTPMSQCAYNFKLCKAT